MQRQRRSLILRSLLICLLGGVVATIAYLPPELWSSVGADVEIGRGPAAGEKSLDRLDVLEDQERRIAESIEQARESVVTLEYATADGPSETRRVATGVVINDAGDVLSIRIDPPPATVPVVARAVSGSRHPVQWLAADAETGLTLLRIKAGVATPIRVAAHEARLGGQVLVIGNPFGLGHSVLRGHVSGLNRRLELGSRQLGGLIQIAVALHPGDSGALVANLRGEWLGLIRSGLALPGQRRLREHDHDLGFAIPARDALWVAEQLRTQGRVDRAYLGVRIDPVATADPPGAVLLSVLDDSPSGAAGLLAGDRIIALNGYPIQSPGDLTDRLDHTLAWTEITLDFVRGERTDHRIIRTVSRPATAAKLTAPADSNPNPGSSPSPSPAPTAPDPPPTVPKADELRLALPREVIERLERLERRLEELEKRPSPITP